jgi:hypothetical protein
MPGVFPDYKAPIVRTGADGRELATARWGMPSSQHALMDATKKRAAKLEAKGKPVDFKQLLRMEPDSGTTNIRNVTSKHWTRWLGPEHRCVVPFNSFSEFNKTEGGDVWFALDETRPMACFAGIWRDHQRPLRIPHHGAECRGRRHSSQGNAGDSDDAGRSRDLDDRASGRDPEAAAAASGRRATDRRPRRQGKPGPCIGGGALICRHDRVRGQAPCSRAKRAGGRPA